MQASAGGGAPEEEPQHTNPTPQTTAVSNGSKKCRRRGARGGRKRKKGLTAAEEEALAKEEERLKNEAAEQQRKLEEALKLQHEVDQAEAAFAHIKKPFLTWKDKPRRQKAKHYKQWMLEGEEDPFDFLDKIGRHYPIDKVDRDVDGRWPIPGVDGCWRCPKCQDVNFPRRSTCYGAGCRTPINREAFELVLDYVAAVKAMLKKNAAAELRKQRLEEERRKHRDQRALKLRVDQEEFANSIMQRTRQMETYDNLQQQSVQEVLGLPVTMCNAHSASHVQVSQFASGNAPHEFAGNHNDVGYLSDLQKEKMRRLESYNALKRQSVQEQYNTLNTSIQQQQGPGVLCINNAHPLNPLSSFHASRAQDLNTISPNSEYQLTETSNNLAMSNFQMGPSQLPAQTLHYHQQHQQSHSGTGYAHKNHKFQALKAQALSEIQQIHKQDMTNNYSWQYGSM